MFLRNEISALLFPISVLFLSSIWKNVIFFLNAKTNTRLWCYTLRNIACVFRTWNLNTKKQNGSWKCITENFAGEEISRTHCGESRIEYKEFCWANKIRNTWRPHTCIYVTKFFLGEKNTFIPAWLLYFTTLSVNKCKQIHQFNFSIKDTYFMCMCLQNILILCFRGCVFDNCFIYFFIGAIPFCCSTNWNVVQSKRNTIFNNVKFATCLGYK